MPLKPTLTATLVASTLALAPLASPMALAAPLVNLQSFAPLVEAVKPAVVTVRTEGRKAPVAQAMPDGMDEFMERFFQGRPGMPERQPMPRQGVGSGFIIEADGIIVTNNHVVENASTITVILDDGTEYAAELLGRDTRVDIAVLKIEAEGLPTVPWGDSDAIAVGDWAVAIGNPLGLQGTVTAGIVSARGRDINSGPYDDYLQVDVAINRGNSGGPLFDLEGQVVGVNTAIISPTGGNVGLGFAIPAAQAQEIVADLIDDGQVERGWIGVSIQGFDAEIAESLGLEEAAGALVAEVIADSPAEAAGLRPGDVIIGFAGTPIEEVRDLTRAVAAAQVGAAAEIEIWRNAKRQVLEIAPGLLETAALDTPTPAPLPAAGEVPDLGLTVTPTGAAGVSITSIEPDAPAAEVGLRPGDVILSANQAETPDAGALQNAVAAAEAAERDSLLLLIEREGQRRFLTVPL